MSSYYVEVEMTRLRMIGKAAPEVAVMGVSLNLPRLLV